MERTRWWMATVLVGSMAVACGPGEGNMPDAANDAATDAVADTMPGDASADAMTMTNPCAPEAIRDLSTMMPGTDGAIHVTGDNRMASMAGGVVAPETCVGMMGMKGYQVVFRYRMRSTAVLQASTANPGTSRNFDTVVNIVDRCDRNAMSLACNDDAGDTFHSTATTPRTLTMGTEVFIVVGGYTPPYMMNQPQGTFELTVRELQPTPVGMPCTRDVPCVENAHCLPVPTNPMMTTCQADGTQGALCRTMNPRCDTGLVCSATDPTEQGICRAPVMNAGGMCDRTGRMNFCAATNTACLSTTATMATCSNTVMEMEPNPRMMPQGPVTMSTAFSASIMPADDVDCFSFTVPAMNAVLLETSDGRGGCPDNADTVLKLYNSMGMMIAENDDIARGVTCSRIDRRTMRLDPGTYTVCVEAFREAGGMPMAIPSYVLTIEMYPAM